MDRIALSQDEVIQLLKLDQEVLDIEMGNNGHAIPVVRAYDDEIGSIHFWCIHCRKWHLHGRGGKDVPYREGKVGHSHAHCASANSPYHHSGVILNVVGLFDEATRKLHKKGTPLYCPKCRQQYSAALNACGCLSRFVNTKRKSSHPQLAEKYINMIENKI